MVFNRYDHNYVIEIIREYNRYLALITEGGRWIDNGFRMNNIDKMDYKEKGLVLENSLGCALDKMGLEYSLQHPMGEYQIADAIVRLNNGLLLRIEAKYVSKEYATTSWKYKNILEWSTKYRDKPDFFYPFTILYINYDFYSLMDKEDFRIAYRNNILISTFRTLPRIVSDISNKII